MIFPEPKFSAGDKVFMPFTNEIAVVINCHPDVFDGWACTVESPSLGRKHVHETNLRRATVLDEIVDGI